MLRSLLAPGEFGAMVLEWIKIAALVIEVLAVLIIVVAVFYATARYLIVERGRGGQDWYHQLKLSLGRSMLLGLEVLIAADVVRTVALEFSLQAVAVLGLLALVRTFLAWSIIVELEGRWPWQPPHNPTAIGGHPPRA